MWSTDKLFLVPKHIMTSLSESSCLIIVIYIFSVYTVYLVTVLSRYLGSKNPLGGF